MKYHIRIPFLITSLAFLILSSAATQQAIEGNRLRETNATQQEKSITEKVRVLLSKQWDEQSFERALYIIRDKQQPNKSREFLLHKAYAEKRRLASKERIRLLAELTRLAKATDEPTTLSVVAVRDMAGLALLMKESGEITAQQAVAEKDFLISLVRDKACDYSIRMSALKAIDILDIKDAVPVLKDILANPQEAQQPGIVKGACLSLMRLTDDESVPDIGNILQRTSDPSVFSTAAYCLAQMNSVNAMVALMEQENKFPDTGTMGFSLVDMEDVILSVLKQPASPHLEQAINATQYLWKEGQRDRYFPLLYNILSSDASVAIKRAALAMMIQNAKHLQNDAEMKELSEILSHIPNTPDFDDFTDSIKERIKAKVMKPQTSNLRTTTGQ